MSNKQEFNEGHVAEAIDRCHVIMTMIGELLEEHPAILKAGRQGDVDHATDSIMNIYQALSALYADV